METKRIRSTKQNKQKTYDPSFGALCLESDVFLFVFWRLTRLAFHMKRTRQGAKKPKAGLSTIGICSTKSMKQKQKCYGLVQTIGICFNQKKNETKKHDFLDNRNPSLLSRLFAKLIHGATLGSARPENEPRLVSRPWISEGHFFSKQTMVFVRILRLRLFFWWFFGGFWCFFVRFLPQSLSG